ncbi:MAG TPA: TetR/AcrR family transcriptional regulator [Solirubrobacterales bacterium]|jgi:AcrR family transcriptional regulator|nr:TetR/AcrR family transcriptional regulator [Solirubrobacterales bacterium]
MNGATGYRLGKRAVTQDRTRQRITGAAERLYLERWYDDVSLREVAGEAGVALQTVVNHFGSKGGLLAAVAESVGTGVDRRRDEVAAGDVAGGVAMIVDEYERIGDGIVRMIALEGRVEELAPLLAGGRAVHRGWVERVFAAWLTAESAAERERRTVMLIAATDVLTWKILRREQGLSRDDAEAAMRESVVALTDRFDAGARPRGREAREASEAAAG